MKLEVIEQISPDVEFCDRCADLGEYEIIPPFNTYFMFVSSSANVTEHTINCCHRHFMMLCEESDHIFDPTK